MLTDVARMVVITGALTLGSLVATVSAEPILVPITSGSASFSPFSGFGGPITLMGTDGFSLVGTMFAGITGPGGPIAPGATVSYRALFSSNDLLSLVTYQGQTYPDVGGLNSPNQASVNFLSTPFTLPALGDSPISITAPFTFTGSFLHQSATDPRLELSLVGSGTGTIQFTSVPGTTWWSPSGKVNVQFSAPPEATPEPGTLVLLGMAVGGAYGVRRRYGRPRV